MTLKCWCGPTEFLNSVSKFTRHCTLCQIHNPSSSLCRQAGDTMDLCAFDRDTSQTWLWERLPIWEGEGLTSCSEINGVNKSHPLKNDRLVPVRPAEHKRQITLPCLIPDCYRAGYSSLSASASVSVSASPQRSTEPPREDEWLVTVQTLRWPPAALFLQPSCHCWGW